MSRRFKYAGVSPKWTVPAIQQTPPNPSGLTGSSDGLKTLQWKADTLDPVSNLPDPTSATTILPGYMWSENSITLSLASSIQLCPFSGDTGP